MEESRNNNDTRTVLDVYNEMTDDQKKVVNYMIGTVIEAKNSDYKTAWTVPFGYLDTL